MKKVSTLDEVLTNSESCTALAGNAEAYSIMKANYSDEMTAAIDNNFSNGLNLLNYKCNLKTYLFKSGNVCSNITGGFKWQHSDATECAVVENKLRLSKYSGDSHMWTNNKINLDEFATLCWTSGTWRSGSNSWNKIGFDSTQSSTANYPFTAGLETNTTTTGNKSLDISTLTGEHYFKAVVYGTSYLTLDNVYMEPAIEPYNKALDLVGIDRVDSLDEILTNSDYCTSLANNTEAVTIMKTNYSTEMTAAIDNNFNSGLNLLNYKCILKCYVHKSGYDCSAISGGWTKSTYGGNYYYTEGNASISTDGGNSYVSCCTVNAIPFTSTGYNKAVAVISTSNWGEMINGYPTFRAVTSKTSPGNYNANPYIKLNDSGESTYTLSLSSYLGNRYMWMYCPSTTSVTLKSLYIAP